MDVRSLLYAMTLAEELHFGRAAEAHFISAQPFGRRIQELERELGTKLFERTSRRVELTEAGARFLPRARRVLASLDDLIQTSEQVRDESVLRIGVLGFGLADQWPATRDLLNIHQPAIRIAFVELDWENQYDAVRSGQVDVAVLHDVGGAEDLEIEPVSKIERYAAVPVESELADALSLTASDIQDTPSVTPVGQPGLADWQGGCRAGTSVEVRSPSSVPSAVAMTGLLGVCSEPARRFLPHPSVRYVPLEGACAISAIATRRHDRREQVLAFRAAVEASLTLSQFSAHAEALACHPRHN